MSMSSGRIILLFILLECLIIAGAILAEGFSLAALQMITLFSERLSLLLFSTIFLLHHKPILIHTWLSEKYYLLFAIVTGIHLVEYLLYLPFSTTPVVAYRVVGGVLAYIFIFSMPLIRRYAFKGSISVRQFSTIETVFLYAIWLVFFLVYLPRVQGKLPVIGSSYTESVALLGWVSTMMGIKLTSLIQFRKVH
jgi:hypothetical protein